MHDMSMAQTTARAEARVLAWLDLPADPRAPVEEQLSAALAAWNPRRLPRDDIRIGSRLEY